MPSLNNYNTRSQMKLDIPLCSTNEGQKSMSFLGPKIWNMLSSNTKAIATTASFTHSLKNKLLKNCNSEQFCCFFLTVDFFSLGEP